MTSDPSLILYACIAKGPTVLAEFSRETDLERLGPRCVERVPKYHSTFSQTSDKRSYTFLINDPFVYFAIYEENLPKAEALFFLDRLKCAFQELTASGSIKDSKHLDLAPLCFQNRLESIFKELLALDLDMGFSPSTISRNLSTKSAKEKGSASPLLDNSNKASKKKRKLSKDGASGNGKDKRDVRCDKNGCKEFFVSMFGGSTRINDLHMAKRAWKRHAFVVLLLDLLVCCVMFGIWLWICKGFKCIHN